MATRDPRFGRDGLEALPWARYGEESETGRLPLTPRVIEERAWR